MAGTPQCTSVAGLTVSIRWFLQCLKGLLGGSGTCTLPLCHFLKNGLRILKVLAGGSPSPEPGIPLSMAHIPSAAGAISRIRSNPKHKPTQPVLTVLDFRMRLIWNCLLLILEFLHTIFKSTLKHSLCVSLLQKNS